MAYGDLKTKEDRVGKKEPKGVYGDLKTKKDRMTKKMVCPSCKGQGCKRCGKYADYNEGEKMMEKKVGAGSDNRS
jgi:hypothetical protein